MKKREREWRGDDEVFYAAGSKAGKALILATTRLALFAASKQTKLATTIASKHALLRSWLALI